MILTLFQGAATTELFAGDAVMEHSGELDVLHAPPVPARVSATQQSSPMAFSGAPPARVGELLEPVKAAAVPPPVPPRSPSMQKRLLEDLKDGADLLGFNQQPAKASGSSDLLSLESMENDVGNVERVDVLCFNVFFAASSQGRLGD